jgi:uncharacterized protein
VRAVDTYRLRPWGLYLARPTPGREQFHYLESWLLPSLGLRASVFHFNPGHEHDQDFYIDVARITVGDRIWETHDHYLDLVVRTGRGTDLVDLDELLEAHRAGLLEPESVRWALDTAVAAVAGLSSHDHDLGAWLAESGMELRWREA